MRKSEELSRGMSNDENTRKAWINQYKIKPFLKELKTEKQIKISEVPQDSSGTETRFEKQIYLKKGSNISPLSQDLHSEVKRSMARKNISNGLTPLKEGKIQHASTTMSMVTNNYSKNSNLTKDSGSPPITTGSLRHTNPFKSLIDTSKRTHPGEHDSRKNLDKGFRATTKDRFRKLPDIDLVPYDRLSTPLHWGISAMKSQDKNLLKPPLEKINMSPESIRGGSFAEMPEPKLVNLGAKKRGYSNTPSKGLKEIPNSWGTVQQTIPLIASPILRSTLAKTNPVSGWSTLGIIGEKKGQGSAGCMSSVERTALLAFYGVVAPRIDPAEKENRTVKYYVGKGNNQRLITELIGRRDRFTPVGTSAGSQLTWTQLELKEFQRTSLYSVAKLHLDDIKSNPDYRHLDISDGAKLTSTLLRLRLFHLSDPHLLKEIVDHSFNKFYMHMLPPEQLVLSNNVKGTIFIGRKSLLTEIIFNYYSRTNQDPFRLIPRTYVMKMSNFEKETRTFLSLIQTNGSFRYPFIVKPGENSNRGNGISIAQNESELLAIINSNSVSQNGRKPVQSLIVQNYMTNPLLYKGRKFDIRCYALLVRMFDRLTFFWYNHGYARTSSYPYINSFGSNLMVHLTNEAVQVKSKQQC
jgi:Tubulin-tyrosine ligase family